MPATTKKTTKKKTTVRTKTVKTVAVEKKAGMVGFSQAVCNFWTGYFDFFGRSTRSEFWFAFLFVILAELLVMMLTRSSILFHTVNIILFIPMIAVITRRFRDAGLSVWWYLVPCLIFYGVPVFRFSAWQRMAMFNYVSRDMALYSLFGVVFLLFCLVVMCLPSKK